MLVVIDANELFSVLISRSTALEILFNPKFEFVSPEFILNEFRKYKLEIIEKSKLTEEELTSFLVLLLPKIRFFAKEEYAEFLQEAKEISPDPDDIDYFALALKLNCHIWSEDKKLKVQSRVKIFSTYDLIKLL